MSPSGFSPISSGERLISRYELGAIINHGTNPIITQVPRQPIVVISTCISGVITASPTLIPVAANPVALPLCSINHLAIAVLVTMWLSPAFPIAPMIEKNRKNCQTEFVCDISIVPTPAIMAPIVIRYRGPYLSTIGPIIGPVNWASAFRITSGTVVIARFHPKSELIGLKNRPKTGTPIPAPIQLAKNTAITMYQP